MPIRNMFIAATAAAFCAGCASSTSTDSATADTPTSEDCFRIRNVTSWDTIGDQHLYIEALGDEHYLVTLWSRCPGLQFTQAIALTNRMGRMCPGDFGRIRFRDGGIRSDCRIENIERVSSKDEAVAIGEGREEEKKEAR